MHVPSGFNEGYLTIWLLTYTHNTSLIHLYEGKADRGYDYWQVPSILHKLRGIEKWPIRLRDGIRIAALLLS